MTTLIDTDVKTVAAMLGTMTELLEEEENDNGQDRKLGRWSRLWV